MKLPEGKSRLDLVREGQLDSGVGKRGRLIVSLDKVLEDPNNERKTFRNMENLTASIKSMGVIEPLTVTPDEGGAFRIITGHRRYRAAKEAGLTQIEVLIRDPEDERARRIKSVISNIQREDVGPIELAEALQSLLDERDDINTQEELARAIGKDKTWVSGMLRILTLPPKLLRRVGSTQHSIPYDVMIRIARVKGEDDQRRLIDAVFRGATQVEIRRQIDELKGKPTTKDSTPSKPKQVYSTHHDASVIIQSKIDTLSSEQIIGALEEALDQARSEITPKLAVG